MEEKLVELLSEFSEGISQELIINSLSSYLFDIGIVLLVIALMSSLLVGFLIDKAIKSTNSDHTFIFVILSMIPGMLAAVTFSFSIYHLIASLNTLGYVIDTVIR